MFGRLPVRLGFPHCWHLRRRIKEFAILVDLQKLLCHVVVVAIIHDEVDANPNRLIKKTLFCKGIRLQQTPVERSNGLLTFGIFSVQRTEIEVRGRIRDVFVSHVCPKDICSSIRNHSTLQREQRARDRLTMDDDCSVVKQHA